MTHSTHLPPLSQRFATVRSSVVRDLLALTEKPGIISFGGGLPAPELFDLSGMKSSYSSVLANNPDTLQYSTTEGNPELRAIIAAQYTAQGLPTVAEDIVITTGSQQALSLLATTLIDPGDVILVERPSYLAALQIFSLAGARIVEIPGTPEELDLEAVDRLAQEHHPVLLYTVPTFQNPTGRTLDRAARAQLAELAAVRGFRIIEDDPYRELRYSGDPLPAVACFADKHIGVSTGSFSKILAPGLRLGWVRANSEVRPALTIAKQASDLHTSTLNQAAAAHYLATDALALNVDRMCDAYRERRDAMLTALPKVLPAGSTWTRPDGGMFVWVTLPAQYDTTTLLPRAIDAQVAYVPGGSFYANIPDSATMRLSFTTYGPGEISEGLRRLGTIF